MNYSEKYSASDAKLNELWQNHGGLNEEQEVYLYHEVMQILHHSHFPELSSLPESKEDYVHSYFVEKILFRKQSPGQTTIHAGFIRIAFRNYLRDLLRRPLNRDQVQLEAIDDDQFNGSTHLEQLSQHQQDKDGVDEAVSANIEQILAEHGLTLEQVQDSAWQWLQAQEKWAQLYLSVHFCPDSDDSPPSLQELAVQHRIASYHYRARKLGITNKKTDLPSDFNKTAIGRWAVGLGIEIEPENISVLLFLFKCLCLATLSLHGV